MSKEIFDKYVFDLKTKKNREGVLVNSWALKKSDDWYLDCWKKIIASGLKFDGKHITLNENGVSYDYVAYKNKMLLAYPESKIDDGLVYKGDEFFFKKENGVVDYKHILTNPFEHNDEDIIGGYCVIKNKRGEFITILSRAEIQKARNVAKTQAIWKAWFAEMCKKTIIKKAIKFHFDDIYKDIEEEDNNNYDLDKANELPEDIVCSIENAKNLDDLTAIYKEKYKTLDNFYLRKEFIQLCSLKKKELKDGDKNENL